MEVIDIIKWNEAFEEICEKYEINVENSEKDFVFTIESWGKLTPEQILAESLNVLDDKLDNFATLLAKAK